MDAPSFTFYTYKSRLIDITDGDSIWVEQSKGHGDYVDLEVRLARIDAWETRGKEKVEGIKAKEYLVSLLPFGSELVIQTLGLDNFGRTIAEVWFKENNTWLNLSDRMVEMAHAEYKSYPKSFFNWTKFRLRKQKKLLAASQ